MTSHADVPQSVYVVIPEAVYDHGVIGVFTSLEAARSHAEAWWCDSDGHHRLRIEEWPLDVPSFTRGPGRRFMGSGATAAPALVEVVPWEGT